jgi:hypothetical protein
LIIIRQTTPQCLKQSLVECCFSFMFFHQCRLELEQVIFRKKEVGRETTARRRILEQALVTTLRNSSQISVQSRG